MGPYGNRWPGVAGTLPTWTQDQDGATLNYDGTSQFLAVFGVGAAISGLSQLSVTHWVNPLASATGVRKICAVRDGYDGSYYGGFGTSLYYNNATVRFYVSSANNINQVGETNNNAITLGVWSHIACVFDGTGATNADRCKIYVNGVEQSLFFSGTFPTAIDSTSAQMLIGALVQFYGLSEAFSGKIGDITLHNRALSLGEVNLLARAPTRWSLYEPVAPLWTVGFVATSGVHRTLTATASSTSATAPTVALTVDHKLSASVSATSNAVGTGSKIARPLTVNTTAASNTGGAALSIARKLTGTVQGVSTTAGADLRVARKPTVNAPGASVTAGADLRVARKVTATLAAASATVGVALGVKYRRAVSATGASNTASAAITLLLRLTATVAQVSATAGGDLRVVRRVTFTAAQTSNTPTVGVTVLRRVTVSQTVASNVVGTTLNVNTGFVFTATVTGASLTGGSDLRVVRKLTRTGTAASATAGGDLRILRRVTFTAAQTSNTAGGDLRILRRVTFTGTGASGTPLGVVTVARKVAFTVTGLSVTPSANFAAEGHSVLCQVQSMTGTATLAVKYRRQATVTVASGAWGNDLYRNLAYQVNGTVLSVTGDALFAATWAVFSHVQTATPTPRLGLRLPFTSEALNQSDTPAGLLAVARGLTVNRQVQSAVALAAVTVRRNLVTLIPLVSESPLAFWRTLCLLNAACRVETPDVTADLWVARWLLSAAVAAGRTPGARLVFEEMLAQGRLQAQFAVRQPTARFRVRTTPAVD